ncbi:MAG: hypothetical protein KF819_10250 [Labilithrix sp.]|nr:hypothetical protein [Labilithrix sp.]
MRGPYRTPEPPLDDALPPPKDVGARRSSHPRMGARGAVALLAGASAVVNLHEHGFVITGWFAKPAEILFDDVDAVYFDFEGLVPRPPQIDLVTFDGRHAILPRDLHDLDRVVAALEREVTRPVVARAKEAAARGEPLRFGPLGVEREGIVLHGKPLAWKDLRRVHAERDAFVFHAFGHDGRFGGVRLALVPHPRALLAVLRMHTKVVMKGLELPG